LYARVRLVGVDRLARRRALVLDQHERGELDRGRRVMRAQRRIGQELAQLVVRVASCAARTAADADLHGPRRTGAVRDARADLPRLGRARRIGISALVALLRANPGQDLPRDVVAGTDGFVDRQKVRRNVSLCYL
jgi:hypothetical protein